MQNAIISLEDLEIKPYLITKLKNAGIESIFDLAVSIPLDLLEYCPGYDERIALDLVMRARRALTDSGALFKDICTAEELLERRKDLLKCTIRLNLQWCC